MHVLHLPASRILYRDTLSEMRDGNAVRLREHENGCCMTGGVCVATLFFVRSGVFLNRKYLLQTVTLEMMI